MFQCNLRTIVNLKRLFVRHVKSHILFAKVCAFWKCLTNNGSHDIFHQPGGLVGERFPKGNKLSVMACNTTPLDHSFKLDDEEKWCKIANCSKKFTNWMQPDRLSLFQIIGNTWYVRITKKLQITIRCIHLIYQTFAESLEVVVARIKRKIDFRKDFPDKQWWRKAAMHLEAWKALVTPGWLCHVNIRAYLETTSAFVFGFNSFGAIKFPVTTGLIWNKITLLYLFSKGDWFGQKAAKVWKIKKIWRFCVM